MEIREDDMGGRMSKVGQRGKGGVEVDGKVINR